MTVGRPRDDGGQQADTSSLPSPRAVPKATPSPEHADRDRPDPATLPDFVALPGWGMSRYTRKGHGYLAFNATEWNAGPGTMVVDGFRGD